MEDTDGNVGKAVIKSNDIGDGFNARTITIRNVFVSCQLIARDTIQGLIRFVRKNFRYHMTERFRFDRIRVFNYPDVYQKGVPVRNSIDRVSNNWNDNGERKLDWRGTNRRKQCFQVDRADRFEGSYD